jgi:hypothetical protein
MSDVKKLYEIVENIVSTKDAETKMNKKCNAFTTTNDTDFWVLMVDEYIGLFNSKDRLSEALKPFNDIHWDESGYGCMNILPPRHVARAHNPKDWNVIEESTTCYVSEVQPINIKGYILKHADRSYKRSVGICSTRNTLASGETTVRNRLKEKRQRDYMDNNPDKWPFSWKDS